MPHFRISLGNTKIENAHLNGALDASICDLIVNKIQNFKSMRFSDLENLSTESVVEYVVRGKKVQITFYKKTLDSENILLVVQAAYKTFRFPNYFSLGFIGRIIVDGIQVNVRNEFSKPKESLLWEFT